MSSEPHQPEPQERPNASADVSPAKSRERWPQTRRLVAAALAVGLVAILVASGALVVLYRSTRDGAEASLADRNLEIARYIAHFIDEMEDHEGFHADITSLRQVWGTLRVPSDQRFMCFVDNAGTILVHTALPGRIGADARTLRLIPDQNGWPTSIGDLVDARADWTGTMISEDGERRISAFAYSHELGGHINIHVPETAVRASVAETTAPVAVTLGIVLFALIPLSAGILLTAYHSTRRQAEHARLTLRDERSEAERRLGQLELFFQNPSVGFALVDRDLRFIRVNAALATLNGRSAAEHAGRTLREVLPDLADTLEPYYRSVIETGETTVGREVRGPSPIDPQREHVWLVNFHPLRDDDGAVIAIACAVYDVTDLRLTERALHETEQRYRAIVETAREGVLLIDRHDTVTYANPRMLELLGKGANDVVGRPLLSIINPVQHADVELRLARRHAGRAETHPFTIHRPGGGATETTCVTNPIFDASGAYAGAAAMFTDVSEHNRAARALRESERRLTQAQRIGGLGSWHWDMRTNVIAWSSELAHIFGDPVENMPAAYEGFLARVHPDDRDRIDAEVRRAARERTGANYDYRILHTDGSVRYLSTTLEVTLDERGEPFEMMGASIDMTERLRSERQRIARNKVLEKLAAGAALDEVLHTLTLAAEDVSPDMLCSVLLLDSGRLRHAAAPSLPDFYNDAIEGLEIGPNVGSCGAAAALGERVIVEDISTHPNWDSARELAANAGLAACWSEPILASNGEVLGTFAVYYRTPKAPGEQDLEFIASTAQLASIAIERTRDAHALRESEERFRIALDAASMGMWTIDLATSLVDCSAELRSMFGVPNDIERPVLQDFLDRIHKDDLPGVEAAIKRTLEEDVLYDADFRAVHLDGDVRWLCGRGRVYRSADGKPERFAGVTWDATDLVIAQRSLKESEQRFAVFMQHTPAVTWMKDEQGRYVFVNESLKREYRLTDEQVMGKTDHDILPPDVAGELRANDLQVFERWKMLQTEEDIPSPEGKLRTWHIIKFPLTDASGRRLVGGFAFDMTKQKQAEAKLRLSEARFRTALKNSSLVVFNQDADLRYTWVHNPHMAPAFEGIVGQRDDDLDPARRPDDALIELKRGVLSTGEGARCEIRVRIGEQDFVYDLTTEPMIDEQGRIVGLTGAAMDITALRTAHDALEDRVLERTQELVVTNRALRSSEERFRSIFENTGVGVGLTSPDGRLVQANPAFLQMMGYDPAPGNGLPTQLMRSSDAIGDTARFQALAAGACDSYQVERKSTRRDGSELWLRVSAKAIYSPSGNFEGAVVIIENITERKLAEETAQRRQNELAHASRFITVGELAAGLAHELNQPLAAISAYADACTRRMAEPTADPAEPRELLGKISGQARRAGHIIHRLKDLVRKQEPKRSRFDLQEMLVETLELVEGTARIAEVEIRSDFPDHLPDVDGDPIQIQQVVLNLLSNAIEVMPPPAQTNGASRHVALRARRSEGDQVLISVEDTGPGFDDHNQDRMFEPFHSTKSTGMGLGLTISRSIIEAHGGKLWAERGQPVGARFCFNLPVAHGKAGHNE